MPNKIQKRLDSGNTAENICHFDIGGIQGSVSKTDEGFLKADAAVTRTGVFRYINPDGSFRNELRHPDDVFRSDSLDTLKMKPITKNHPQKVFVNAKNADKFSVGHTGETIRPSGHLVMASLLVTHEDGIDAIEKEGLKEISCGYRADLLPESGEYEGKKYDCRQVNIRYNHVALVKRGRAGAEVRLNIDHADNEDIEYAIIDEDNSSTNNKNKPLKGGRVMPFIKLDSGLSYEVEQAEVVKGFEDLQTKLDSAKAELETKNAEISKLKADVDTEKEKSTELQKKIDGQDEHIDAAVKARVTLVNMANTHLDEEICKKLDSMSNVEIKKAIVLAKFPEAKLDEKDEVYIDARFDSAMELLEKDKKDNKKHSDKMSSQRKKIVDSKKTDEDDGDKVDNAQNKYLDSLTNAWKEKKD